MTCLLPVPSVWRYVCATVNCRRFDASLARNDAAASTSPLKNKSGPVFAAMSASVLRRSNPHPPRKRRCPPLPHAHIRPPGEAAHNRSSFSSRLWRTIRQFIRRPWLARSAPSALRSPASGARDRRSSVSGRFPNKNLVRIDPQSKRFFCDLQCPALMAAGAPQWPSRCRKDRIAAGRAQVPRR
jgi:hypothetical protein